LQLRGANFLRQRLVLSLISGRPVRISQIRSTGSNVGLADHEACFLRLLDAVTDGGDMEINETGTALTFYPGSIVGGTVSHSCPPSRGVTYFLEPLLLLGPFCKDSLHVTLLGVTNHPDDVSVDTFRSVTLSILKPFNITNGLGLKVLKRGSPPLGGGKVVFECPVVNLLQPIEWIAEARVKRIRGVAFSTKVSSQFGARMVDSVRGIVNMCCPDVWIYTDHFKGEQAGKSPGFGMSLFAETVKGTSLSCDICTTAGAMESPEDMGKLAAARILEEIELGGVVDTSHQFVPLFFMSLADETAPSKIRLGKLTPYTTEFLRNIRAFTGVKFRFEEAEEEGGVICTCVGTGHRNLARRTF